MGEGRGWREMREVGFERREDEEKSFTCSRVDEELYFRL
jgi:hypothetical protein